MASQNLHIGATNPQKNETLFVPPVKGDAQALTTPTVGIPTIRLSPQIPETGLTDLVVAKRAEAALNPNFRNSEIAQQSRVPAQSPSHVNAYLQSSFQRTPLASRIPSLKKSLCPSVPRVFTRKKMSKLAPNNGLPTTSTSVRNPFYTQNQSRCQPNNCGNMPESKLANTHHPSENILVGRNLRQETRREGLSYWTVQIRFRETDARKPAP